MKRICALIVSVIMAAAALTACGSGDSSSKAEDISSASSAESTVESTAESTAESKTEESKPEESKTDESKAEESKAEESKAEESTPDESKAEAPKGDRSGWGPLAKEYTEKLEGGVYTLDMTAKSDLTGEVPMLLEVNGKNAHMKTAPAGMEIEVYIVDGKTYSMMPSMNAYTVTENASLEKQNINTYALADTAQMTASGEEDGMQTETYSIPVSSSGNTTISLDSTVKYYFDADGNLKKIVTSAAILGDTTVEVNNVTFGDVNITLPDLSGMTKLEQGSTTEVDPKAAITMTMALLGITEDMVKEAGYTVEQLAAMDSEEMAAILADIAKKNGIE